MKWQDRVPGTEILEQTEMSGSVFIPTPLTCNCICLELSCTGVIIIALLLFNYYISGWVFQKVPLKMYKKGRILSQKRPISNRRNFGLLAPESMRFPQKTGSWKIFLFNSRNLVVTYKMMFPCCLQQNLLILCKIPKIENPRWRPSTAVLDFLFCYYGNSG